MSQHLMTRIAGTGGVPAEVSSPICLEPVYTPQQVAAWLQMDESSVRRQFIDRPGVIVLGRDKRSGGKRSYTTLRIPLSVLRQLMERP